MKTTNLRPSQGGKMHKPVGEGLPEPWELKKGDLVRILPGKSTANQFTTGTVTQTINSDTVVMLLVKPVNAKESFCYIRDQLRLVPPPPEKPDLLTVNFDLGPYVRWPESEISRSGQTLYYDNGSVSWSTPKSGVQHQIEKRNGVGDFNRVTGMTPEQRSHHYHYPPVEPNKAAAGVADTYNRADFGHRPIVVFKTDGSEKGFWSKTPILVKNTNIPDGVYSMSATVKEKPKEPEKDYRSFNWDEFL